MSEDDDTGHHDGDSQPHRSQPAGDQANRGAGRGDERTAVDLDELAALVDDLEEASTTLIERGREHDVPAIEHNAQRIRDVVHILEQHVPEQSGDD
ncbi:hypothetical protein [Natronorubrum texcoconense]|uniref:Uncharacterized protein n=1 Tax=Natronorubrum texcoconense TaxID=1095776 RepID=A0A1G8XMA9_9EURY|nr:hypothetical protein [Natronorubrum texcoconense]SDJ91711.1 hypothetical protein SAMN04515672_1822 [Natronorubrum texcoconense]